MMSISPGGKQTYGAGSTTDDEVSTAVRTIIATTLLVALIAPLALADKLILTDGREFEGTVTIEKDSVLIVMEYARLRFDKDKVLRIELKDLPKDELRKRLEAVDASDADALLSVARWAASAGLQNEAAKIIADVLKLNPDHAAARAELGHVKIDESWYPFDKAMELARSKLEAEQFDLLLDQVLPNLEKIATRQGRALEVQDLLAQAQLRAKKFTAAASTFAGLAEKTRGEASLRYSTIAEILHVNPDGMYVLREPYPPDSHLLRDEPALPAGPASLANPLVLEVALRDRAKEAISAGQELMDEAQKIEASEPAMAHVKYQQAEKTFRRADALAEDIARSYRVEIVRRRIALIRKSCQQEAEEFDAMVQALGKRPASPDAYRQKMLDMLRRVDNVSGPLRKILALAKPYPRELFLEVQWAESDLRRMKTIRDILVETLNDKG